MPSARVMRRQVRLLLTPADNTKTPVRVNTHTHTHTRHSCTHTRRQHGAARPRKVVLSLTQRAGGGCLSLCLPALNSRFQSPRTHQFAWSQTPLRSNRRPLVLLPHSRASLAPPPSLTRFALRSPPFSVVNVPGAPRRQGLAGAAGAPRPCLGRRRGAGLGQSLRRGRRRGGLVPSRRRGCPPRRGVCERIGLKP